MNFEKYGNKLDKLLYEIEKRLPLKNTNEVQIGGGDGPDPTTTDDNGGIYSKIISYSIYHISVLVHLDKIKAQEAEDKNINASVLETPQISYTNDTNSVSEYSIEQQLRLGCDNKGNMYNYSIVLTRRLKIEEAEEENLINNLGNLGKALSELSTTIQTKIQTADDL